MLVNLPSNKVPEGLKLQIGNDEIKRKTKIKFLGMTIDDKLDWTDHVRHVRNKISSGIYAINKVKHFMNRKHLLTLYYSLIYPYLDYGISLWGSTCQTNKRKVFVMQKKAVRIISGAKYNDHTDPLFTKLKILKLEDIHELQIAKYMYALNNGMLPKALINMFTMNNEIHTHNTRNRCNPHVTMRRTIATSKTIRHKGPVVWYTIPNHIKIDNRTLKSFTRNLRRAMLAKYSQL
jgi:hypothetical protein